MIFPQNFESIDLMSSRFWCCFWEVMQFCFLIIYLKEAGGIFSFVCWNLTMTFLDAYLFVWMLISFLALAFQSGNFEFQFWEMFLISLVPSLLCFFLSLSELRFAICGPLSTIFFSSHILFVVVSGKIFTTLYSKSSIEFFHFCHHSLIS